MAFLPTDCQSVTHSYSVLRRSVDARILYIDLSEWVQKDIHTGIQRVVRAIARQWLMSPPVGYSVVPIAATLERGYRIHGSLERLGIRHGQWAEFEGAVPLVRPGDVVFGLDFSPVIVYQNTEFFTYARAMGARVYFHLHDIICLKHPAWFPEGTAPGFDAWLRVVLKMDGLVCVSRSVLCDLEAWIARHSVRLPKNYLLTHCLNGMDIAGSVPTVGVTSAVYEVFRRCEGRVVFAMVGSIEPRKGHADALHAFERLWDHGLSPVLWVVGRPGWSCVGLVDALRNHPRFNIDVFWLNGVSDEELQLVYAKSSCLLAASMDEGFGLPLAEAMHHGLPVLARDIPVFREVACDQAVYFPNGGALELSIAIQEWMHCQQSGKTIVPSGRGLLTWEESAKQLSAVLRL